MEALYLLIPLSVVLVFIAVWIFLRATDTGQFDDLKGPGMRILQDDDRGAAEGLNKSGARDTSATPGAAAPPASTETPAAPVASRAHAQERDLRP